jgi:hypothetical protein
VRKLGEELLDGPWGVTGFVHSTRTSSAPVACGAAAGSAWPVTASAWPLEGSARCETWVPPLTPASTGEPPS